MHDIASVSHSNKSSLFKTGEWRYTSLCCCCCCRLTCVEPYVVCDMQFGSGQYAPFVNNGDKGRYTCGHNLLLAHASAVQLYRQKYPAQAKRSPISFSTLVTWAEPASTAAADKQAAQNRLDAEVGWFLDPVFVGD